MQSEIEFINRLTDFKSNVSCHYLITIKGKILQLVKDNKVAGMPESQNGKNLKFKQ